MKYDIWGFIRNQSRKLKFHYNRIKQRVHYMKTKIHFRSISLSYFYNEKCLRQKIQWNSKHIFSVQYLLSDNRDISCSIPVVGQSWHLLFNTCCWTIVRFTVQYLLLDNRDIYGSIPVVGQSWHLLFNTCCWTSVTFTVQYLLLDNRAIYCSIPVVGQSWHLLFNTCCWTIVPFMR
jgi:hypothetical protein